MAKESIERNHTSDNSGTETATTQENVSPTVLSDSENLSQKDNEADEKNQSTPALCFDMRDATGATEAWEKVDETYKKQAKSLKETHVKYSKAVEDMVKKAGKKRLKDKKNKKEWEALFKRAAMSRRTNKHVVVFGLSLAITEPDFFPSVDWRGSELSSMDEINVAWAASQNVFGSVWRRQPQFVYDTMRFPKQLTSEGMTFIQYSEKMEPPFLQDEIFNDEDPHCLHDLEAKVRRLVETHICQCKVLPDWEFVIRLLVSNYFRIQDDDTATSLKTLTMRLLRTDPKVAFGSMADGFAGKLPCNSLTTAWAAVYNVMGCGWTTEAEKVIKENLFGNDRPMPFFARRDTNMEISEKDSKRRRTGQAIPQESSIPMVEDNDEVQVVTPAKQIETSSGQRGKSEKPRSILRESSLQTTLKDSMSRASKPSVSIAATTDATRGYKKSVKPREKTFLSLPKVKKSTTNTLLNALHGKKYITYLKIKLPKWVHPHNTTSSEKEVTEKFSTMVETVLEIDPNAYLVPWNNDSKVTKITGKNFNGIPSRACANMYCDNLFVKQDMNSWIRIKVAHDSDRETWDEQESRDRFKSRDMFGAMDRIQAQKQACAGWLLGSHPTTDCRKLEQALKLHSQLANMQLEVRLQVIKLENSSKVPYEELVRACHVHTDYDKVYHVRAVLNKIYGHSNINGD